MVHEAFAEARSRLCPVVIGVPLDIQEDEWSNPALLELTAEEPGSNSATEKLAPGDSEVAKALDCVLSARNIVVLAGLGAINSGASSKCTELAEMVGGLLATTLPARGLFWEDPFYLGVAGGFASDTARKYLQQADLVIAVGTRLASHTSDAGKLWSAENVLHIDIEPRRHSQGIEASRHALRADATEGVACLIDALNASPQFNTVSRGNSSAWRSDQVASEIASSAPDSKVYSIESGLLDPRDVVSAMDKAVPTDWHTVNSSGHCSWFAAQMYRRPANRFFTLREFGAIGNGLAFAIGVAVADTERPVVLFDGDGSFLMHIQELETIARHNLKLLVCIINDGAYGSEIHKLRAHGLADTGGTFGRPDFAAIARGFGLQGKRISNLSDVSRHLDEFNTANVAAVWDFHVSDEVVSPLIRRSHGLN